MLPERENGKIWNHIIRQPEIVCRRRFKNGIAATFFIAALSFGMAFCSFAAANSVSEPADTGKSAAELNGYTEERWRQLNDNTLEYGELQDLVHTFNPTVSEAWKSFDSSVSDMSTMIENLQGRKREISDLEKSAKDSGDYSSYANYAMQNIILKKTVSALSDARDLLARPVTQTNRPLRQAEAQVTFGAKNLMIAYQSMEDQRQILSGLVSMDQTLYDNANSHLSAGTGTETDVLSAKANLLSDQVKLSQLTSAQEKIKKQLILMCGWKEDADPVIGEVPASDLSRMENMNPQKDITAAIGNNYTLISFRSADHTKSTASYGARTLSENEMEQNLLNNLTADYNGILSDKTGLEASEAGMAAAQITKNAADKQYELGLITTAQYRGLITSFTGAQSALKTADRTLFQAMETYDAAVAGICSTE